MNFPATRLPEFLEIPVTQQKELVFIIISIIIISFHPTNSQSLSSSPSEDIPNSPDSVTNFQPSLAVVIGVLAIMFSLTFCLLIYAKCCHTSSSSPHYSNQETFGELPRSLSRVSGVDKTVIESLPFFRFSTLKGWRNGLECSICLSKFEDIEILRLLPKCKHAFHIDCVDRWLEKHSGCPLCRCKVSEEDAALFAYSSSLRFLSNRSDHRPHEGSNLELFVEREGSARFGSRRSFHKMEQQEIKNQEILEDDQDQEILHKFNHRIIIPDYDHQHGMMMKNRWSNMSSSDLLFLKSEMIACLSSNMLDADHGHHGMITSISSNILDADHHHQMGENPNHQSIKIKEEIKRKREFEKKIKKFPGGKSDIESSNGSKSTKIIEKRSMSEIVVHPRFLDVEASDNYKEERLKKLWIPIARRTVQWFANRDRQLQINTKSQV